jgi:hypothetical protein
LVVRRRGTASLRIRLRHVGDADQPREVVGDGHIAQHDGLGREHDRRILDTRAIGRDGHIPQVDGNLRVGRLGQGRRTGAHEQPEPTDRGETPPHGRSLHETALPVQGARQRTERRPS